MWVQPVIYELNGVHEFCTVMLLFSALFKPIKHGTAYGIILLLHPLLGKATSSSKPTSSIFSFCGTIYRPFLFCSLCCLLFSSFWKYITISECLTLYNSVSALLCVVLVVVWLRIGREIAYSYTTRVTGVTTEYLVRTRPPNAAHTMH